MRVEATTDIQATLDEVYAFITRPENGPRWQEGAAASRRDDSGPIRLGSTMSHEGRWLWMRIPTVATVTVHDPPRAYGYDIVSSLTPEPSRMRYVLEPATSGAGTRLTLSNEARLRGWMRPLEPIFRRNIQGMFERDVARLKRIIEIDLGSSAESPVGRVGGGSGSM